MTRRATRRVNAAPELPYLALHRAAPRLAEAMDDAELIAAMRAWDERAWNEFVRRFRPVLVEWARRARVPDLMREACVDDVLADEANRLTRGADTPPNVGAYLQRAARSRLLNEMRSQRRREQRLMAVAERPEGPTEDWIVVLLQSEHARRAVAGAEATAGGSEADDDGDRSAATLPLVTPAVLRLGDFLHASLAERDRRLFDYLREKTSHEIIAGLLGTTEAAVTMRVSRLRKRLRARGLEYTATLPLGERNEVERYLRAVGLLPPLTKRQGPAAPTKAPRPSSRSGEP